MRRVASLTPLRADISRMVMPGSECEDVTARTVHQLALINKTYRFFYTTCATVWAVKLTGITTAVLGTRVAYGLALIAAPRRLALRWLGPAAQDAPLQVALRGLGAREALLHGGALLALRSD